MILIFIHASRHSTAESHGICRRKIIFRKTSLYYISSFRKAGREKYRTENVWCVTSHPHSWSVDFLVVKQSIFRVVALKAMKSDACSRPFHRRKLVGQNLASHCYVSSRKKKLGLKGQAHIEFQSLLYSKFSKESIALSLIFGQIWVSLSL